MERPYRRGALLGGSRAPSTPRDRAELHRNLVSVAIVVFAVVAAGLILGAGGGFTACNAGRAAASE